MMKERTACQYCGSNDVVEGSILSTGKAYFRPGHVKFAVPKTADVPLHGFMCLTCGHIEMVGNVKKARSLVGLVKN